MFLIPLTLQDIAPLKDPSERVTLPERELYERGLQLIDQGAYDGEEFTPVPFSLLMHWIDEKRVTVKIVEERPQGPLKFTCSRCLENGRQARTCEHQWAAFVLLWRCLALESDELEPKELEGLAAKVRELAEGANPAESLFAGVVLDSVSLMLDEPPQLQGAPVSELLGLDFSKYKFFEFAKRTGTNPAERELLSPRLWNLPEIFRKKVSGFTGSQLHEASKINRLASVVRYNFSNGMQLGAKEILRHPLQKKVPGELLPQAKAATPPALPRWPLVLEAESTFVSRELQEIEEIIQDLLARIAERQRSRRLEVFLQTEGTPGKALALSSVEFDPATEVDWRVEFQEKKELLSEFKLISFRKRPLQFFESFAVEPVDGVLIVHPWRKELKALEARLARITEGLRLEPGKMPTVELSREGDAKVLLRYLRTRPIPVKITGETRVLEPHRSLTGVHLEDGGLFFLQQEARVQGGKDLVRRGWTARSEIYLQTLAEGLPFLLNIEPRELASRARNKRDWDLKLLKHQGILHYVFYETLSMLFENRLSDGAPVPNDQIFTALHGRVQTLLIAGSGGAFVRDIPLTELCSKPVLSAFEDFVKSTLAAAEASEAFYSEGGEVVLEGVVGREFRLIFALIRKAVEMSGGEIFRRSRGIVVARAEAGDELYKFPSIGGVPAAQEILESLQALIPHGFKLFYKGQPLHELAEDEFHVDFVLKTETDARFFNWFELNPRFFLRGEEVDSDKFLSLGGGGVVEYDGKLYLVPRTQMPSLRRLESFWQKLQSGKTDATRKQGRDKVFHLPRNQTLELLALRASGVAIRGDHDWNEICEFYDRLGSETRVLKLPDSVKGELKPYQARGVQWLQDLYKLRLGALLADDMGLGKTLQTLGFLDDLRARGEMGQVLVVVPSSLIYNWRSEIEKFTPELPVVVFSNKDRDDIGRRIGAGENLLVITTYGLLMEHEAELSQYKWRVLVFDEAQNLKNITAKRTSAARALNAQFKICLTGTPMENHYGEFYSLVDILVPGSLGRREDFRRRFVNTEMVTREELDDLKLKIKPLLLRRTKKEIQDQLPEKQETKVSIAFEDRQKEIYRDIALSYNQRVQETMASQGEASVQLQMLTALLRLRQACSDPAALPNVKYDKVPPKLETLLESLEEIIESGESALVFTQFLQTLEHTTSILKKAGIPVFVLHGGIPTKQRQKVLEDFNRTPGGAVLLMTLKTGGVGLNLTKASYVFHLEPWWNPSVENQATDRAHRLGQSRAVQVFRYIMHESLEEKIELLKDRKDRKFQSLFSQTEGEAEVGAGGSALSKSDFDLLLGIRE